MPPDNPAPSKQSDLQHTLCIISLALTSLVLALNGIFHWFDSMTWMAIIGGIAAGSGLAVRSPLFPTGSQLPDKDKGSNSGQLLALLVSAGLVASPLQAQQALPPLVRDSSEMQCPPGQCPPGVREIPGQGGWGALPAAGRQPSPGRKPERPQPAYEKGSVVDAVALVSCRDARGGSGGSGGSGTCTHYDAVTKRGILITCKHVIEGQQADVSLNFVSAGIKLRGKVIATDKDGADLAAVSFESDQPITWTGVGETAPVEGTPLWQVGFPAMQGPHRTYGKVLRTGIATAGGRFKSLETEFITDHGDSGGGVFDGSGRLVAVLWGGDDGPPYRSMCVSTEHVRAFEERCWRLIIRGGAGAQITIGGSGGSAGSPPPMPRPPQPATPTPAPSMPPAEKPGTGSGEIPAGKGSTPPAAGIIDLTPIETKIDALARIVAKIQNTPGPKGDKGEQGPPGVAGPVGPTGKDGANPDLGPILQRLAALESQVQTLSGSTRTIVVPVPGS